MTHTPHLREHLKAVLGNCTPESIYPNNYFSYWVPIKVLSITVFYSSDSLKFRCSQNDLKMKQTFHPSNCTNCPFAVIIALGCHDASLWAFCLCRFLPFLNANSLKLYQIKWRMLVDRNFQLMPLAFQFRLDMVIPNHCSSFCQVIHGLTWVLSFIWSALNIQNKWLNSESHQTSKTFSKISDYFSTWPFSEVASWRFNNLLHLFFLLTASSDFHQSWQQD